MKGQDDKTKWTPLTIALVTIYGVSVLGVIAFVIVVLLEHRAIGSR